jgi:DNA-binding IclR family transcriptional regulator
LQSLLTDRELIDHGDIERRGDAGAVGTRGYATSHDEVIPGLRSIAVPLAIPGHMPASIAVVFVSSGEPDDAIGRRLIAARDATLLAVNPVAEPLEG